jgi:hypothetical protein
MTDRPIIFSAPMVRGLLREADRPGTGKTQTRRIWKLPTKGEYVRKDMGGWEPTINGGGACFTLKRDGTRVPAPETIGIWNRTTGTCLDAPYQIGDRLWVREAWAQLDALTHNDPGTRALIDRGFYRADNSTNDGEIAKWRPSIHMPRWASRLTLTVTDVRVQRLHEISEEDAIAEGWQKHPDRSTDPDVHRDAARDWFSDLWDLLHGKGAWGANPFVVALTFTVAHGNIDALPKELAA